MCWDETDLHVMPTRSCINTHVAYLMVARGLCIRTSQGAMLVDGWFSVCMLIEPSNIWELRPRLCAANIVRLATSSEVSTTSSVACALQEEIGEVEGSGSLESLLGDVLQCAPRRLADANLVVRSILDERSSERDILDAQQNLHVGPR